MSATPYTDDALRADELITHARQLAQAYPSFTFSTTPDLGAVNLMDDEFKDADTLYNHIISSLRNLPPLLSLRIKGAHSEPDTIDQNGVQQSKDVQDFDIVLDITHTIPLSHDQPFRDEIVAQNAAAVYRGAGRRKHAIQQHNSAKMSDETMSLYDWCQRYCKSPAKLKVFRITRQVHGLNMPYIEDQICTILRSTAYRGNISITFPVEQKTNPTRLLLYLSTLWLILWPYIYYATQYWDVYSVRWKFSLPSASTVVVNEHEWLQKHGQLIMDLAMSKFTGNASRLLKHTATPGPDIPQPDQAYSRPNFNGEYVQLKRGRKLSGWGYSW